MDRNKYFIFSDESGRWADPKCNFYVRSWIKITEERYLYLKGLWQQKKLPHPTKPSLIKNSNRITEILIKKNLKLFLLLLN